MQTFVRSDVYRCPVLPSMQKDNNILNSFQKVVRSSDGLDDRNGHRLNNAPFILFRRLSEIVHLKQNERASTQQRI